MRIDKYLTGLLILAALGSSLTSGSVSAKEYFTIKNNVLERPTGFREWVYVGTPLTPNDMNNGKANFQEFHTVYIDPKSWEHWKKTGKFRDGAILIKEMTSV
ncbi:cytochrome P460 family protein, partial [Nitrosospira sp. NpAV]|uniref:cytochrome P460 family protein n=1 Tax=Nitrosospira sp. NpAV TaxID=58133 RepID=UPI0005A19BDC